MNTRTAACRWRGVQPVIWVLAFGLAGSGSTSADWFKKGEEMLKGAMEGGSASGLSRAEMGAGLKEALRVGTETVVSRLGQTDGFNADKVAHIPLPESLETVKSALQPVGMAGMLDDLELRLNRAAEEATPKAKALFSDAIAEMTLEDVKGIYNGPDDAATRYFRDKMSQPLAQAMRPVVDRSLADVGAVAAYDNVMGQYDSLPFVPDVKANLTNHVVEKGMDGIFYYLAKEEAAIRNNPAKRTTELLQRVFGSP